jgi:hypothetical protein
MKLEIPKEAKDCLSRTDMRKFAKIRWDRRDWEILYECIGFAMFQMIRRRRK